MARPALWRRTARPCSGGCCHSLRQAANESRAHRLVSYLVRTTPPGNVRVSTRFRFTQLSSAVKNGVPPPTSTGWVTIS